MLKFLKLLVLPFWWTLNKILDFFDWMEQEKIRDMKKLYDLEVEHRAFHKRMQEYKISKALTKE